MPILGPFIAALWAFFSRMLATRAGQWVATALGALGLSFVATETLIQPARDLVAGAFGGIPGDVAAWVGVLNFDKYVSIILSAYAAGGIKRAILARRSA